MKDSLALEKYLGQAIRDAKTDAEEDDALGFIAIGFCFWLIGVIIAFFYKPTPSRTYRFIEKSEIYIRIYTEEYTKAKRKKNIKFSAIGWGVSFCVFFMFSIVSNF